MRNSIEGGWSDPRYGGSLFFCVDDDLNVWGTYSNLGVYWGKTDAFQDVAKGRWYQVGAGDCVSGDWEAFYENNNATELNLIVYCDSDRNSQPYNFTASRFTTHASDDECLVVKEPTSFVGTWKPVTRADYYIDFCTSKGGDNNAEGSFWGNHSIPGYTYGRSWENYHLYQGRFAINKTGVFDFGYVLFFPRDYNKAVLFQYEGEEVDDVGAADPHIAHVYYPFGLIDRSPDNCELNRAILDQHISSASSIGFALISLILVTLLI
jgi:hypothetical protein